MKFRKKHRVFPGFNLNFSKKGVSATIGPPGLSVNFSSKGTYLNTGIPGTGLYDRKRILKRGKKPTKRKQPQFFATQPQEHYKVAKESSSTDLTSVQKALEDAALNNLQLTSRAVYLENEIQNLKKKKRRSKFAIWGLLVDAYGKKIEKADEDLMECIDAIYEGKVNFNLNISQEVKTKYQAIVEAFETASQCDKIWDITSRINYKSKATEAVRVETTIEKTSLEFIYCDDRALAFLNVDGYK